MPRVFVTSEDPNLDYSPALQYGNEIVGIFPPGQVHLNPQVALYRARGILSKMHPDDFLALAGDPVKIGICVTIAAELFGRVKLLRWNRHTLSYLPIEVNFAERTPNRE